MPPVVDVKQLLSLDTLRRKINWPNITEEIDDDGNGPELFFTIHAGSPHLSSILLSGDPERRGLNSFSFDAFGFLIFDYPYEWQAVWRAIKLARDLVSGRRCFLEGRDARGEQIAYWLLPAGQWPNLPSNRPMMAIQMF